MEEEQEAAEVEAPSLSSAQPLRTMFPSASHTANGAATLPATSCLSSSPRTPLHVQTPAPALKP